MKMNTKALVEAGVMIALAYALSFIKIATLPQGGSVTAGSMIPLLIYAYRWGPKNGLFAGLVYGTLQFILGPKWSFHPVSILFDYSIAFAWLGLAGVFGKGLVKGMMGVGLAIGLRFVSHVISGVVVFSSYAPEGTSPVLYSMIYNGSYLGVELIVSLMIFALLYKPLQRAEIMTSPIKA
jgi:thiamine transporter